MDKDNYYSIGQVAELCQISRKTLRYYEKIGLLIPDKVADNGYRYYDESTLLTLPVIRYYKQMGFKLDEIKELVNGAPFSTLSYEFTGKLNEHRAREWELSRMKHFISDWLELIVEAQMVIEEHLTDVTLKVLPQRTYYAMPYAFCYDYRKALINIPFNNGIENLNNHITGPVCMYFSSAEDKAAGRATDCLVVQEAYKEVPKAHSFTFPAGVYASIYHIGDFNHLSETYCRLNQWIETHDYDAESDVFERYVVDYWTTEQADLHVTELLIRVHKHRS